MSSGIDEKDLDEVWANDEEIDEFDYIPARNFADLLSRAFGFSEQTGFDVDADPDNCLQVQAMVRHTDHGFLKRWEKHGEVVPMFASSDGSKLTNAELGDG